MKKVTVLLAALIISVATYAQTWTLDKAHAKLGFTVTHLMVNDVDGMFKSFDATLTSSKNDFSDAVISLSAQSNSVFTDQEKRDAHLRSADFFDVEKFPTLTFKSRAVKVAGAGKLKVTGDLTIHGITKTVVLDVSFKGPAINPMNKKQVAGFKVSGEIKRSDFKIGDAMPSAVISEDVSLSANVEFQQG